MRILPFLATAAIATCVSPAFAVEVPKIENNTVMVTTLKGDNASEMTGTVINAGKYRFVLTARHGLNLVNGKLSDGAQILLHDFNGRPLGDAVVIACGRDPKELGGDTAKTIKEDVCALLPVKPLTGFSGLSIPTSMPTEPITVCHTGALSWDHGASGSGLIFERNFLIGVLSVSSNEKTMPRPEWEAMLRKTHHDLTAHVTRSDMTETLPDTDVTVSSCGTFAPIPPDVAEAMGFTLNYKDSMNMNAMRYDNYSFPQMRPVHISGLVNPAEAIDLNTSKIVN